MWFFFVHFSKTFDTINHHILLGKMNKYGIRGLPHARFSSYLTNRKQYVKVLQTKPPPISSCTVVVANSKSFSPLATTHFSKVMLIITW